MLGSEQMATELRFVDKSEWQDGPWKEEPDKVFWIDEDTKLDCLARRNHHLGFWCGYVGVKKGHPAYKKQYEKIDSKYNIDVHGGLTFSEFCSLKNGKHNEFGICHPSDNGEKVWWLGFDCGHWDDLCPNINYALGKLLEECRFHKRSISYKDLSYVKQEIKKLAKQLANVGSS